MNPTTEQRERIDPADQPRHAGPRHAGEIRLLLAGDVMTGRGIDQVLRHPGDPTLHEDYVRDARDYVRLAEAVNGPIAAPLTAAALWGDALAVMDRAAPDLRIVNLETAITRSGQPWPGKGIHYRMHPANIDCLLAAQLDACSLANNHVLDWRTEGLLETLQTLRDAGLKVAGAGAHREEAWAPARLPLPGRGDVLLFGWALPSSGVPADWAAGPGRAGVALLPDLSPATAQRLASDIARCRRPGDLVVGSIHWGGNWGLAVPQAHREFAHRLIDAGAVDVVHGHSSHHALPVEVYRGKLVLYGCGDLVNDYEGIDPHDALRSDVGCLYLVTLQCGSGRLDRLDVVPLRLKRFRLTTADAGAHHWLARVFTSAERALGQQPARQASGAWSLQPAIGN